MRRSSLLAGSLILAGLVVGCGGAELFGAGPGTSSLGGSGGTAPGGSGGTAPGGSGGIGASTGGDNGGGGQGGNGGGGNGGDGGSGGIGKPCLWGGEACDPGLYCLTPDCGIGTCQPLLNKANQLKHLDAQCGCDGVTYFNPTIAQSQGASLAHAGRCQQNEALKCNKLLKPCPSERHCALEVSNATGCLLQPLNDGNCWGVPAGCDPAELPKAHPCIGVGCADLCSLIQSQNPWYPDLDNTC